MSLNRIQDFRGARLLGVCLAWVALLSTAFAQAVSTTTVQGTVYTANGTPGAGTLQISWPAFTTASNQTVAAGRLSTTIGADGFVSVSLAPNLGSSPAGLYYTAVYHMSDGTTSTEYWVIPAAAQANLAQVRSQVMPAAQAVQAVSKAYVDQAIQSLAQGNLTSTGGQLTGPLYLTGDPSQALQAADKHYVDATFAQSMPLAGGAATGPLTATQLGGAYQVDQFAGADFGAKLQACLASINVTNGGTCDARNFSGTLSMSSNVVISKANTTVLLPCATIATSNQIVITAGTRNVTLRGCALRGASQASGSQGGTVLLYSGPGAAVQVGDNTYAINTPGFHLDDVVINTTGSSESGTEAIAAYRTQELDLESLYLLGNANQTAIVLDGTGNYTGGTFYDNHISGFQTAISGVGHQITNSAATDWLNASTFVRLHIDCPTSNGSPISGTYGVDLKQGDGNTFTGGDIENCGTAMHLGANAQNNTIVGLRNENSIYQVVADAGSSYNSWMTGGTMFTGKLSDNGTRNSFLDSFHRSFNSLNGDWYGSQQDSTLTNHYRLGIGSGNERGLLDRYQTDYGYRWTMGLSDATGGEQFYQVLDELNGVYRISVGQYNNGQASTNNQTVINSAGSGAVVLNGSSNAGTGGVVFGSGGANAATVATVNNAGNAQFNGTLQVGGTSQSAGTMTVRNNADAEVDYYLWPGLTSSQKGSYTYKDYNGNSQWYMVKDASNNWALNSAVGGLDSFKAYQSTNSGDTYVNASNGSGVVRVNYEAGSGTAFNIYGGGTSNLYASFSGATSIKMPGLAASSGRNCLQIDASGYISNTGTACGAGSGSGTVNNGSAGQIAYYNGSGTAVSGMSAVPISAGGTGASSATDGLAALGGVSLSTANPQTLAGPLNASVNSQLNVMAFGAKGDCTTDDTGAFELAQTKALTYAVGASLPAVLYLPKPPGGCYIVSNWTWKGVSLEGQPSSLGPAGQYQYNVTLRSKPGQDVLHVPDPTTTSGSIKLYPGWSIRNISFIVDNGTAGTNKGSWSSGTNYSYTDQVRYNGDTWISRISSNTGNTPGVSDFWVNLNTTTYPHRWPGRWFDDGAMTAGSAVFSTRAGDITCGDVGQQILVSGAAASGANLVTTIQSVYPCWQSPTTPAWSTVTLATAASTTVANAHSYISVLGLPVTQNIGNCAIAADMKDGNPADWIGILNTGNYGKMENVVFNGTSGNANYPCAMFVQGNPILYGLDVRNFGVYGLYHGIVQATAELNSFDQSSSGDYEVWDHGIFFNEFSPWISYNGFSQHLANLQFNTQSGPQILNVAANSFDFANGWVVENSGIESPSSPSAWGWRVDGSNHSFNNVSLTSTANGQEGYWDAVSSICNCGSTNVQVAGYGNKFFTGQIATSTNLTNVGLNNNVFGNYNASPFSGIPMAYDLSAVPFKGYSRMVGRWTGDAGRDFNGTASYSNDDLIIWPTDLNFSSSTGWGYYVQPDSSSPSGYYMIFPAASGSTYFGKFQQFIEEGNLGNSLVLGTNLPLTGATVYLMAKCPAGTTSFNPFISASGGTSSGTTFSCSTSYQTYSFSVRWATSDSGKAVSIAGNGTVGAFYAAYWQIVPWKGGYNGFQPQPSDGSIVMNPTNATFGVSTKAYPDANSQYGMSWSEVGADYVHSVNGSTNLNGGALFPSVPSRVTYWIGAPAVFVDTLGAAAGVGDTALTLGTATTSAWGNSGYILVDQEVMKYAGVSAGQTTINVTRGQYGTIAQAHSNGATAGSVGTGQLGIKCNGNLVSNINVYYASNYSTFSAPFPAQSCSGYPAQVAYLGYNSGPSGQQWNIAQIQISPEASQLPTPATSNQVPVSAAFGPMYAFNNSISLAGSGAGITTGPTSGTTAAHVATFSGTTGQIQDAGVGMPLSGTSGSIGGSALTAGQCASGTATVAGATTSMAVAVSPAGGNNPGTSFYWQGYVSSAGTVTVRVCALVAGTPTATTYNVRVIQ